MRLYRRLLDYDDPKSLGVRLRRRRLPLLTSTIETVAQRIGRKIRIVDLGGTASYWRMVPPNLLASHVASVVLINLVETSPTCPAPLSYLRGDVCSLPDLADDSFDLVHSNSVIEHVGDWQRMKRFAAEARRLSLSHFIQSPNFWFPIEPHFGLPFLHWLPEQIRARLCLRFGLGHSRRSTTLDAAMIRVQGIRLLDRLQMAALFPDSYIHRERLFGLTKSLIAVRTGQP